MWVQSIFVKNIEVLVDKYCDGVAKKFNDSIAHRGGVTKWRNGNKPNLEIFLRVVDEFNVSANWLLTGQDAKSPPEWTFDPKVREEYNFLTNIVSEANEGTRKGRSVFALCELIINRIEYQLIRLRDDLRKTRKGEIKLNNYRRRKEDRL